MCLLWQKNVCVCVCACHNSIVYEHMHVQCALHVLVCARTAWLIVRRPEVVKRRVWVDMKSRLQPSNMMHVGVMPREDNPQYGGGQECWHKCIRLTDFSCYKSLRVRWYCLPQMTIHCLFCKGTSKGRIVLESRNFDVDKKLQQRGKQHATWNCKGPLTGQKQGREYSIEKKMWVVWEKEENLIKQKIYITWKCSQIYCLKAPVFCWEDEAAGPGLFQ